MAYSEGYLCMGSQTIEIGFQRCHYSMRCTLPCSLLKIASKVSNLIGQLGTNTNKTFCFCCKGFVMNRVVLEEAKACLCQMELL